MRDMKVYLGTDHAGFELKEKVKAFLSENGYEVEDCGASKMDAQDDYPDFVGKAAQEVSGDSGSMGIVFGGSGQGEAIVANKYKGVRCATYYGFAPEMVKLTREHNDSNVLSLGARFLSEEEAISAVKEFLEASYSGEERHSRRIEKIKEIEERV